VQADAVQPFVATWGKAHTVPHVPQLFVSLAVLTQAPLHKTFGVVQPVITHLLAWQASVPPEIAHWWPHVPQLFAFVVKLTSQPFDAIPSQSAYPELHPEGTQFDEVQAQLALSPLHAFPHIPQLVVVSSIASQPSLTLPLQSA
jgi:hypothetical protein